jgi:tricorn protease-like protein
VIAEKAIGADFAIQANRGIVIDENAVRVFNLQTGSVEGFIEAEMELRSTMADLSANGERVAIASNPYSIAVIDLPEFTRTDIDQGHTSRIDVLTISDDGHRVASATRDGLINVWRADGGGLVASHTDLDAVLSLALDSTGEMLAIGLVSGEVLLWQLSEIKPKAAHHEHQDKVSHVEFSSDSGTLFSAGVKTRIVEINVADRSVRQVIQKRRERLRGFVVDDKNNRIYASGYDKALYAWDLSSGSELINYSFFSDEIVGMGYDRDESELYAVNNNGELMKLNGR